MRMNSPTGKSILALVRGGAFAHAGETEAIDFSLASVSKDPDRVVLDAGCGLGGTADYVTKNGWGMVTGFDIDAVSVALANERFPDCTFVASDVALVGSLWQRQFDLIYCFNTIYAFPDQAGALGQLALTAKPGATLVIFEYTDPELLYAKSAFRNREEASFWQPLHPAKTEAMAGEAGWKLGKFVDITKDYVRWYDSLLQRVDQHREEVICGYGEEAFAFVRTFYSSLRDALADRTIGGGLFQFLRES